MTALERIQEYRDHYERRHERVLTLVEGGRRDDSEEADYADGVRYGLDLALSLIQADRREAPC